MVCYSCLMLGWYNGSVRESGLVTCDLMMLSPYLTSRQTSLSQAWIKMSIEIWDPNLVEFSISRHLALPPPFPQWGSCWVFFTPFSREMPNCPSVLWFKSATIPGAASIRILHVLPNSLSSAHRVPIASHKSSAVSLSYKEVRVYEDTVSSRITTHCFHRFMTSKAKDCPRISGGPDVDWGMRVLGNDLRARQMWQDVVTSLMALFRLSTKKYLEMRRFN